MDRNTLTGFILLAGLMFLWTYLNRPSEEEIARQQQMADSLQQEQVRQDSLNNIAANATNTTTLEGPPEAASSTPDSVQNVALQGRYGAFANAASGTAEEVVLENDALKIIFSTQGGTIKSAFLKNHYTFVGPKKKQKVNVELLNDDKNKFEYQLPINGAGNGVVKTSELFFQPTIKGNTVTFRADAGNGRYLEQIYTIGEGDSYLLDYDLKMVGLDELIPSNTETITLNWVNYLGKLEKSDIYEKQYSTIYYREREEGHEHLKFNGNHQKEVEKNIQWISNVQQFFNSALIAEDGAFTKLDMEVEAADKESDILKKYDTDIYIPIDNNREETIAMQLYVGPNEYERLDAMGIELENIIQFGWGVFGAINRGVIRPLFSFLSRYIGSAGIVILVLTIIVKLVVYPLTYKMLHSQAKMKVLKPQLEKLKEKIGDDQQQLQMEQMKLYRETGANPLGGCWPMVLQMPIWFALYRFFPAAIEFRHTKFLWANDLSSYDSVWTFGDVPVISAIYGDHVSLFTLLWVVTTILYSYYNSRHMTMPNPSMKYIQYFMPIMFIFFFNNYAAGLTCYLLFSNVFNIGQNLFTQNFIINHKKIAEELEANKKKPKKKSGFQARLQDAMEQQREVQRQQDAKRKKGKKK